MFVQLCERTNDWLYFLGLIHILYIETANLNVTFKSKMCYKC